MEDEKGNVVYVHGHHYKELNEALLKQMKEEGVKIKIGDLVKTRFDDGDYKEHMWIKVTGMLGDKVIGKLSNEPELVSTVKYGEMVTIQLDTITGYMNDDGVSINPLYDKIEGREKSE